MRLPTRQALQSLNHRLLDLFIGHLARGARSGFVLETLPARFQESGAPLAYHAFGAAHLLGHRLISESFGTGQHDTRPSRQYGLTASPVSQRLQTAAFLIR